MFLSNNAVGERASLFSEAQLATSKEELQRLFYSRFAAYLKANEEFFAYAVHVGGVYGVAKKVSGIYYEGQKDKGDDSHGSSLHTHVENTEKEFLRFLTEKVDASENAIWYGRAVALGHELFDLRHPDNDQIPAFTRQDAAEFGFIEQFTDDLDALGKKPNQSYLGEYVSALSEHPVAAAFKLKADLRINMSRKRKPVSEIEQSQKFRDKKSIGGGYEMEVSFLLSVLAGRIAPGSVLAEYIVRDPIVSKRIKGALRADFGLLARNVSYDISDLCDVLRPRVHHARGGRMAPALVRET